jgi:hypothetical protein
MRKPNLVISVAWLIHLAAWFLPATRGVQDDLLKPRVFGWEAFLMASRALLPGTDNRFLPWYNTALIAVSAITTVLFIGSLWAVFRGSRSVRRASAWAATVAFATNAHWYLLFGSDGPDLGIGYFLWWLSFAVLAIGLFGLAGRTPAESAQKQAALLPR